MIVNSWLLIIQTVLLYNSQYSKGHYLYTHILIDMCDTEEQWLEKCIYSYGVKILPKILACSV